jgi:hypothetical protein
MRVVRLVAGAMVCLLLPLGSRALGFVWFGWTMYAWDDEFRIDMRVDRGDGRAEPRNPTELAEHAAPSVATLLAGADQWRRGPASSLLRAHLGDLAAYACREERAAGGEGPKTTIQVELAFHERRSQGPERVTRCSYRCAP